MARPAHDAGLGRSGIGRRVVPCPDGLWREFRVTDPNLSASSGAVGTVIDIAGHAGSGCVLDHNWYGFGFGRYGQAAKGPRTEMATPILKNGVRGPPVSPSPRTSAGHRPATGPPSHRGATSSLHRHATATPWPPPPST